MADIIASKDYRDFIKQQQIEITDRQKATLIYNSKFLTYGQKESLLSELFILSKDKILKHEIGNEIFKYQNWLPRFEFDGKDKYYTLLFPGESGYSEEGIFTKFKEVYQYAMENKEEGETFRISKKYYDSVTQEDEKGVTGCLEFNSKGLITKMLWLDCAEEYEKNKFTTEYVDLPMLFRRGDIVRVLGTDYIGIVDSIKDDADEEQYRKIARSGDYTDFQVTVNLMFKGNEYLSIFNHDHIPPTELEYANLPDDDRRKGFLEYMVKTLYHNSLFFGSGRSPKRMDLVLDTIKTVWQQYPDLRLGQLLLNVCGPKDLFSIEDEMLLELLEKNKFSRKDE